MKNKEFARADFIGMVRRSWTWEKMTLEERKRFEKMIAEIWPNGTYSSRFKQLNAVYSAFLAGLGYNGPTWREKRPENIPF